MSAESPTLAKRVVDPDTADIDGLVSLAGQQLREAGIPVGPATLAARLNVPLQTVARQWARLGPLLAP